MLTIEIEIDQLEALLNHLAKQERTPLLDVAYKTLQDGLGNNLNLYVNSNGSISGSSFTGSLFGTASQAVSASRATSAATASFVTASNVFGPFGSNSVLTASFATTASFALNASSTFPFTGSAIITGSLIITGSAQGNIISASISSNTCSLDFSRGDYFTSLITGTTFFNVTNAKRGQTVNLLLTTLNATTASFSTNVKQVIGAPYTPTAVSNRKDVITFISWDGVDVYISDVKNLG